MALSNYPPGVSGREPEISGPDDEGEVERYCPQCDEDTIHDWWRYGNVDEYECRVCGRAVEEFEGL